MAATASEWKWFGAVGGAWEGQLAAGVWRATADCLRQFLVAGDVRGWLLSSVVICWGVAELNV